LVNIYSTLTIIPTLDVFFYYVALRSRM